jgi:RNA polymerase sigma-B factor
VKYSTSGAEVDDRWLHDALDRYAASRDPGLRDEIVAATMWIATRGARRFNDCGEPFDDLVQVARIGLLKAIERYDATHGVHFGAYATPTIMGELRRHFRDYTWSLHVPRRTKDMRPAVTAAKEALEKEFGRSPLVSEIAGHMRVSADEVIEVLEANNAYRGQTLDPSGTGQNIAVEADFEDVLNREVIAGLLGRLRPRERKILQLRFFEDMGQEQIASRIGTSQVHVGRLIAASLAELRRHLEAEHSAGSAETSSSKTTLRKNQSTNDPGT